MSGHSKWATTHRQKSAADAKKGAIFTKLGNLITIAAKEGGGDLNANFKLRLVVEKARSANMPKDNIERAIKRGTGAGADDATIEEATYEIFGPAGSAFLVEAVTDNKNRTVSEIKAALNRNNGQLGAPNSVLWMFEKKGVINLSPESLKNQAADDLELKIIDLGAQDITKSDAGWEIFTNPEDLPEIERSLKSMDLVIAESGQAYVAKNEIKIADPESQEKIEGLFGALDGLDDVNNVYTNANW